MPSRDRTHRYAATITWTGNTGPGTTSYAGYSRAHTIAIDGKPVLQGSADPAFRGDPAVHNPEELLLAALSTCHMLSYLALAALGRLVVTGYVDAAVGEMQEDGKGSGRFTRVTLRPLVTLAPGSDRAKAEALHHAAHEACFIAASVNFPVEVEPAFNMAA